MFERLSEKPLSGNRFALCLEYDGSAYYGWQKQLKPAMPTIQEFLEKALSVVADEDVTVQCAGRTDARVHASNQVVHFEASCTRSEKAWVYGCNANLPRDITVKWVKAVPDDFHARFSATARTYRYCIANQPLRPGLFQGQLTHVERHLDEKLMHQAAQLLLGEKDFSAYRAAACQSHSAYRYIESIDVFRQQDLVVTEITANAFLLHMVRNIMGVLIPIGLSEKPVIWAKEVLDSKDRNLAGKTAPPDGLYLVQAHYPEALNLPRLSRGPFFIVEKER